MWCNPPLAASISSSRKLWEHNNQGVGRTPHGVLCPSAGAKGITTCMILFQGHTKLLVGLCSTTLRLTSNQFPRVWVGAAVLNSVFLPLVWGGGSDLTTSIAL